ncbi:MAG: hypothetical protein ACTSU5_03980 [Promethearchaeota archaeon]
MERKAKITAAVGVAAWILGLLLLPFFFIANMLAILVGPVVLYFAVLHGPTHARGVQAAKVGLAFLTIEVVSLASLVQNPAMWASQIARMYDKRLLVQPHSASIEELREHFDQFVASKPLINDTWHWASYNGRVDQDNYYYGYYNMSELDYSALTDFEKLLLVDYYIRNNTIRWTDDEVVYGVGDYKGTPDEMLREKDYSDPNSRARDDCDGIAVVTVSLLLNLNESGWVNCVPKIGSGQSHWYTVAWLPGNDQPVFLYYWRTIHAWVFFDPAGIGFQLGQPLAYTVADVVFDSDNEEALAYVAWIAGNAWVAVLVAFGFSVLLVLFARYPRHPRAVRDPRVEKEGSGGSEGPARKLAARLNPFKRRYRWTWSSIAATFGLVLLGVLAYTALVVWWPSASYAFMWLYLGALAAVLTRDLVARGLRRLTNHELSH